MVFTIRWAQFAQTAYSFGSQIEFAGHRVTFHNPLMSPSYAITSWDSKTNFQQHRLQPTLPLLKRGHLYRMELVADVVPSRTLYVKVTFFDRFDKEISFSMLKEDQWSFTYPEEAFAYRVELINAGCHHFSFDSLVLSEESEAIEDVRLDDMAVYAPADHSYLHVVFLEDQVQHAAQLPEEVFQRMGNVMLIGGDPVAREDGYLGQKFEEKLKTYLHFYRENGLDKVRWIGYGPVGNVACIYYSSKWMGQAYLSSPLPSLARYQRLLSALPPVNVRKIWERSRYADGVYYYGLKRPEGSELVAGIMDGLQLLEALPFLNSAR